MSQPLSAQGPWQAIFRQQQLANARRWLHQLQTADNINDLVSSEYDNLLRALEVLLKTPEQFDLAYHYIMLIFPAALGFADWGRWDAYLQIAIGYAENLTGKNKEMGTLLGKLADLRYHQGLLNPAIDLYQKAVEILRENDDIAGYAKLLAMMGILQDAQGRSKVGIDYCRRALGIAIDLGDQETIAHVSLNLSHIYYRGGALKDAKEMAERAYSIYRQHNQWEMAVKSLINLTAIWVELDEWAQIDEATTDISAVLEENGDVLSLSKIKNNLGVVAYNRENFLLAEQMWHEALGLHTQIQEPTEQASLYNNLGMVYTVLEEWQTAEEMLKKSIDMFYALGDFYRCANSQDNLAELFITSGRKRAAATTLESAIATIDEWTAAPAHAQELRDEMARRLAKLADS